MQLKKRNRMTGEFWSEVGAAIGGGFTGQQVENLLKNLQSEYRQIKALLHLSGINTSSPPKLRKSEQLYMVYEDFYQLYNPHGGSAVPGVVMTESSAHVFLK
jgi:hypothetical protein